MISDKTYSMVSYHDDERHLNVEAVCDRILFSDDGNGSSIHPLFMMSVLGPHSAVRGILAAASTGREIRCDAFPEGRFYGPYGGGGRIVTQALSKEVTHGAYLAPEVLLSAEPRRIVVLEDTPKKVYDRLNHVYALPMLPEWAQWLYDTLRREKQLVPLTGKGVSGCSISTSEEALDKLISDGVRRQAIRF